MVSPATQKLIKQYQLWSQESLTKETTATVHVDEVASAIASFYEKIRGVVEWKEEHLLRRAAIERILKRRLFLQKKGEEIAEPLVLELIRSGHFPNDRIPEVKIIEVKNALNKYLYILGNSPKPPKEKEKIQLYDWLMNVAACDIEEILCPPIREKALIDYITELMNERVEVVDRAIIGREMPSQEKETQIYIACQRALFKLDAPIISYYILSKRYPKWQKLSEAELKEITENIYSIWEGIEKDLKHPLSEKFYKICERYDTAYLILGDILSQNLIETQNNFSQPEVLENLIRKAYQARLQKLKSRMTRAAFYSTISIFVTKMLVAFGIEVPFDRYVLGVFNSQTLLFNILIPPLLMFFLVLTIRPPRKDNLDKVILEVMKIVYEKERKDVYTLRAKRKRGLFLGFVITTLYIFTFLLSFGLIVWGLTKLNFGVLSIVIFLMFFSLIAFAGVKIRERAKELQILEQKTGFFGFIIDILSLPFIRVGRWLSSQWVKYNVILVLITALIDMPLQLFTEFLEHWRTFLREKREEIH